MTIEFIYFYYAVGILFGCQLLLLILLSIKKTKRNRKNKKQEQLYQATLNEFVDFLYEEGRPLPDKLCNPENIEVAERIFSETITDINDPIMQRKLQDAAISIFTEHYKKRLLKGNWPTRVNTLYFIEDFKIVSLLPVLQKMLQNLNKWDEEKNQTILALAAINDLTLVYYLNQSPDTKVSQYLDVFSRFDTENFEEAIHISNDMKNFTCQLAIINIISLMKKTKYQWMVEKELQSENMEMRIQALKGLYRLNYMKDIGLLVPFFQSLSWEERLFSTRVAGALLADQFEAHLEILIGDEEWWVRNAAAEALLNIFGEEKLVQVESSHTDSFARDMAKQWLTSGKRGSAN
ncbi:HEAT repeat domain-containing protein [Psychrobacillus sp. L3]|uniref:HEAT repeat domain-containing protein n=1 Tax=Psychrobacillus sp. L3 TaxID=3236891 RepID=UPI0036F262A7